MKKNVYVIGLPIIFSFMQIILLFFVPESPKYLLLKKNNAVEAEKGWFLFLTKSLIKS
jgi:hypothetical protein